MSKALVNRCPAGAALDAAVAKIRGDEKQWEWRCVLEGHLFDGDPETGWCYDCRKLVSEGELKQAPDRPVSRNIAAALELWTELAENHYIVSVCYGPGRDGRLHASIRMQLDMFLAEDLKYRGPFEMDAKAETVPLAIVRAYLGVHGVTEVEVADE